MCKLYFFVNDLAYTASILLLVVIAAERYIAIIHPLRSRGYFTAPRLLVAQMVVWVVAAAYNIPVLLMFDTTYTPDGAFCYMSLPLLNLKTYYTVHFVLWYLLPLAVILVMYGRISCTLWATSTTPTTASTTVTTTRSSRRGDNTTSTPTPQAAEGNHHPYNAGGVFPKCCVPPAPSSTCVSYCDDVGQNGFALVKIQSGGTGGGGGGGGGGGSSSNRGGMTLTSGGVELRRSEAVRGGGTSPTLSSCKIRGSTDPEGRQGGGGGGGGGGGRAGSCRTPNPEKYGPRSASAITATQRGGEEEEKKEVGVEMVGLQRCRECFSCLPGDGGPRPSPTRYSPRLDYSPYHHHHHHHHVKRSKRAKKKRKDDYAYELSDMPSSDDYDAYSRVRADGGNTTLCSAGESLREGRGSTASTPRRLRTHCRISSPRGLTSRRRVIRLLVAVVTIFALCVLPLHLRNLLHYWNVYDSPGGIFDFLSPIASVMMYLNCGLNPFIYWMFSDHFRRSLKDTLCFWKRSKRNSSRLMMHSPRQLKNSLLKKNVM
ncbi:hypothetical protein ACOMHN_021606 [Nucella lapillus]